MWMYVFVEVLEVVVMIYIGFLEIKFIFFVRLIYIVNF